MNSVVLKRKFTGRPAVVPCSAVKIERMQRMFDESREKVLAARNEEIEKAYQKGKEDGISRTISDRPFSSMSIVIYAFLITGLTP